MAFALSIVNVCVSTFVYSHWESQSFILSFYSMISRVGSVTYCSPGKHISPRLYTKTLPTIFCNESNEKSESLTPPIEAQFVMLGCRFCRVIIQLIETCPQISLINYFPTNVHRPKDHKPLLNVLCLPSSVFMLSSSQLLYFISVGIFRGLWNMARGTLDPGLRILELSLQLKTKYVREPNLHSSHILWPGGATCICRKCGHQVAPLFFSYKFGHQVVLLLSAINMATR